MKMMKLAALFVAVLSLPACVTTDGQARADGPGPREVIGALGGAVLGGLGGSQIGKGDGQLIATGVGAVAGMLIGREIGMQLDRVSQMYHARTTQTTLERTPTGRTRAWQNPDAGTRGTVTPTRTFRSAQGPCREYEQSIVIGGEAHTGVGTACRMPDGRWKLQ